MRVSHVTTFKNSPNMFKMDASEKLGNTQAHTTLLEYTLKKKQSHWHQQQATLTEVIQKNIIIQRHSQDICIGKDHFNVQQTWMTIPRLERKKRKSHNKVHFTQRKTKEQKGNICEMSMLHQTKENRDSYNKNNCRGKYYILSRRSQHTNIRLNHHETPCAS